MMIDRITTPPRWSTWSPPHLPRWCCWSPRGEQVEPSDCFPPLGVHAVHRHRHLIKIKTRDILNIYWYIEQSRRFWGDAYKVFFLKTRIPPLIFWSSQYIVIAQFIFLSHLTRWLTVRLLKIPKMLFRSQWFERGVKRICWFLKSHLPSVWPSRQSPDARHYHWKTLRGVSPSHK